METLALLLGSSIIVALVVLAVLVGVTAERITADRREPDMTDRHDFGADEPPSGRRRRAKPSRTMAEDVRRLGRTADAVVQRLFRQAGLYPHGVRDTDNAPDVPGADDARDVRDAGEGPAGDGVTGSAPPAPSLPEPDVTDDRPRPAQSSGPAERTAAISPYTRRYQPATRPDSLPAPERETDWEADEATLALTGGARGGRLRTATVATWLRPEGYVEWQGALLRARWRGGRGRFPAPGALVRVDVRPDAEDDVLEAHPLP
ncbi:hypothetical protein [Streptomyces xanthii]|uniref:Uncharacterized protein n=1 Tax=Streptomyces xanthii TaxID=2768069 RepID=A0A7H1B5B7_9ACTN|nr:hypothetical protein [Streptomyces xanthii]QNS03922.1 hypothetical protein IAG42_09980 [Streptomyces xanthii]